MFTIAGIAMFQPPPTMMSIILGASVRVGLEDSPSERCGRTLKNTEGVKSVRIANEFDRTVATSAQDREMLGLLPMLSSNRDRGSIP